MRSQLNSFKTMSKSTHSQQKLPLKGTRILGFTLFEIMIALTVFAFAVVGLATALDRALNAGIEVRQHSLLRSELESQLAIRMAIPLEKDTLVLEAKDNRGIRVEESIVPFEAQNQNGDDVQNIKKLTITASMGKENESASILVNQP
jgi:type II secretory pathway component PulJ